jgi:hypothetical protein
VRGRRAGLRACVAKEHRPIRDCAFPIAAARAFPVLVKAVEDFLKHAENPNMPLEELKTQHDIATTKFLFKVIWQRTPVRRYELFIQFCLTPWRERAGLVQRMD